jgi:small subunit ribosomal protein S9
MFAEERDDLPQEPEGGPPEEDTPAGASDQPDELPASEADADAVGPEIEGAEELAAAGEGPGAAAEESGAEAEEPAEAEQPAAAPEEPAAAVEEPSRERPDRSDVRQGGASEEELIPGMHLEPDLVLEESAPEESEFGPYVEDEVVVEAEAPMEAVDEAPAEPEVVALTPLELAADARYRATGKRKRAVARVILKPGEGTYSVNGRHLDEYFPRVRLQRMATQPLEATGNSSRMDVVARIHGGGVAAQASALRHGIARALVEADPALRTELKRRGYLTRDPRVKERKKAGLKKARKRPQFSKR